MAIETTDDGSISFSHTKRGNVLGERGGSGNHGVISDMDELVHGGESSNIDEIAHMDVPPKGRSIGKNATISYDTVMGDVGIGHEEVMIPDDGFAKIACGAWVEHGKLADEISIPNDELGLLSRVFEILRLSS